MNYAIVDLEATCWEERTSRQNEIIEIGAVLVDEQKNIISTFEQFVRPLKHPVLSEFCTNLTSIAQADIAHAPLFADAVESFQQWMQGHGEHFLLCSWGFYDKRQLQSDCALHGVPTAWLENHINLKQQYAHVKKLRREIGMENALINEGMELEGTHHRGIDDARNITKIFLKYFDIWKW